ncbi:spherulation-specific family 4 protein [Streptomyces sp. SL13]|uniref:Spherulation-specific family 4 protein n=1 Tax=Streptantibioticus silvisoli TaxID=2705255 RepID=A0AA90GZD3_9ACTN|nr:spherulation-specific family 4 protein [Streptantibioticus silvisoli]MDI5971103.1 spherulation-specific family 4 protein [Streptantibioticus silvisoli]
MRRPIRTAFAGAALAIALVAGFGGSPASALPSAGAPSAGPAPAAAGSQQIAVPAYFDPGQKWDTLTQGAGTVGLAVANPDSGPGQDFDSGYADAIRSAHDAGVKVLGYVDTGYFGTSGRETRSGQTSVSAWQTQVEQDVDTWYSLYGGDGLDGIFFDDALADCGSGNAHVQLYIDVKDYVKQHSGAYVVDNPGTGAEQCYTQAADTLVTFEGSYSDYTAWTPPSWEASAAPSQIWHLVYDASGQSQLDQAMSLSKSRNAGYVYVTDDVLDNPWDTLASYWTGELSDAG